MKAQTILVIAGISGAIAVGLGAFGAHALSDFLIRQNRLDTYETAVLYHFIHTLLLTGLAILCILKPDIRQFRIAAGCCIAGICIFSGSLYVLCMTGLTFLGAITPIGGILFIASWLLLLLGARKIS